MSRGRRFASFESYEKALREGVGTGCGEFYKPWIRPQDFTKSRGIRSAIRGLKTFRQHNTLSSVESEFYYLAEFNDSVIDIREQFPLLPITLTQNIARIINVNHPSIRRRPGETDRPPLPAVMTTDFLLTFMTVDGTFKYQAYSIKPNELISRRDAEKQEIERLFWEGINVRFQIYTGSKINTIKSSNIRWFTAPFRMNGLPEFNVNPALLEIIQPGQHLLTHLVNIISSFLHTSTEDSLTVLKFLLATKSIEADLTSDIAGDGTITILRSNHQHRRMVNESY